MITVESNSFEMSFIFKLYLFHKNKINNNKKRIKKKQ